MERPAAKGRKLLGAVLAVAALLLTAPVVHASRPAASSAELLAPASLAGASLVNHGHAALTSPAHATTPTAALEAGLEDRGFRLFAPPPRPVGAATWRPAARSHGHPVVPSVPRLGAENLASGVST